jgi:hypothetical protein
MNKNQLIHILIANLMFLISCNPQTRIAGNYQYKTECLGIEGDGTQTLKSWGKGRNRFDALEQAKKNAVYAVIFSGINDGSHECEIRPLVAEVNAREKFEAYFNRFFQDGGEYQKYISMRDERFDNKILRERKEGIGTITNSAIVVVNRPQLKAKLINDGIIK